MILRKPATHYGPFLATLHPGLYCCTICHMQTPPQGLRVFMLENTGVARAFSCSLRPGGPVLASTSPAWGALLEVLLQICLRTTSAVPGLRLVMCLLIFVRDSACYLFVSGQQDRSPPPIMSHRLAKGNFACLQGSH